MKLKNLTTFLILLIAIPAFSQSATTQPSAQTVSGSVLDTNGKPVAGATVVIQSRDQNGNENPSLTCTSGDDGHFSTPAPVAPSAQPGNFVQTPSIFAISPGAGFSQSRPVGTDSMNLKLLPASDAQLTFVDSSGKPAAGVKIWPVMMSKGSPLGGGNFFLMLQEDIGAPLAVTTDADGKCTFHGLPRGVQIRWQGDDDRFAQMGLDDRVTLRDDAVTVCPPIHLRTAASIVGHVINPETGKPQAGIAVQAQAADTNPTYGWATAVTDADGKYELKQLGPGEFVLSLDLQKPGEWTAVAQDVQLAEGDKATSDLTLTRGGFVNVLARDADTLAPLAGISIGIYGPAKPRSAANVQGARTRADGKISFRVPAGKQYVYSSGMVPDGYEQPTAKSFEPEVTDGQTATVTFDFPVDHSPTLSGTVMDLDGKPAAGAMVLCDNPPQRGMPSFASQKSATTDEQGHFEIRSVSKGAELRARLNDLATEKPFKVNDPTVEADLNLSANGVYSLDVRVTDTDGTGIGGATATLTQLVFGGGFGMNTTADDTGKITFDKLFTDMTYFVNASFAGFGTAQKPVQIPRDGSHRQKTTLVLKKTTSIISGTVTDELGTPLANMQVSINGSSTGYQTTTSDAQGKFSFAVVDDAKNVILSFRAPEGRESSIVRANAGDTDVQLVSHHPQTQPSAR